MTKTAKCTQ